MSIVGIHLQRIDLTDVRAFIIPHKYTILPAGPNVKAALTITIFRLYIEPTAGADGLSCNI